MTADNRAEYCKLALNYRLHEFDQVKTCRIIILADEFEKIIVLVGEFWLQDFVDF